jgi:hypothetical protein
MPIENRNLKPGTKLTAKYHKQAYSAEVVEGEGGKLHYRLADGREFKSPSAAGMAITGHACDGWVFWSVETTQAAPATELPKNSEKPVVETQKAAKTVETAEGKGEQLDETSASTQPAAPNAPEPGPAKKRIFRLPNQKGVPEGQTRWYCHDCGKSFLAPVGETPETCPQGHKAV